MKHAWNRRWRNAEARPCKGALGWLLVCFGYNAQLTFSRRAQMPGVTGRVALVSGASQGIGRACALALAEGGATLALAARNEEKLAQVFAEIQARGGQAAAFRMDVSNENEVKTGVKAALERFGKIEVLVNDAGITRDNLLLRM